MKIARGARSRKRETEEDSRAEPGQASSGVFRAAAEQKRRDFGSKGWTVAEQFEREGFSYRLMRRPLEVTKAPPRLTKREEAAVALAHAGHSNKRIAQVLDVSPSTVGVLLFRAATKLNAKSRGELLASYERSRTAPETSDDEEPE